jgi:hypothetical protein
VLVSQLNSRKWGLIIQWERAMLMIDCLRDRKERLQLAKRKQESLADEVKLLKQGGLVGGDSALDSEMLNPQCLSLHNAL